MFYEYFVINVDGFLFFVNYVKYIKGKCVGYKCEELDFFEIILVQACDGMLLLYFEVELIRCEILLIEKSVDEIFKVIELVVIMYYQKLIGVCIKYIWVSQFMLEMLFEWVKFFYDKFCV